MFYNLSKLPVLSNFRPFCKASGLVDHNLGIAVSTKLPLMYRAAVFTVDFRCRAAWFHAKGGPKEAGIG